MKRAAHWIANIAALVAVCLGYLFFLAAVLLP